MSLNGFKAILLAPYFTEMPQEISAKWLIESKKSAAKAYKSIRKSIRTRNDFDEKIANPIKKNLASFINPDFVSKHEHTYGEIMDKTRQSLANGKKEYLQGLKEVYETGRFAEKLEQALKRYAQKWRQYIGPLRGYQKGKIKGLSALGVMALCADLKIKDFLKNGIDEIKGDLMPVTDKPLFKRRLANSIVRWGSQIIELGYEAQDMTQANEELNKLVNEYLREGIASFAPGGASHLDFIVVEILDPTKPGMKIKQLGLDIQVSEG